MRAKRGTVLPRTQLLPVLVGVAVLTVLILMILTRRRRAAADPTFGPGGAAPMPRRVGPYDVVRRLREEGRATVYVGRDPDGAEVLLKVLPPGALDDAAGRRRFEREIRAYVKVRHPSVCGILDFSMGSEAPPYLAVEMVEGETLEDVLARERVLPPARALRIVVPLAQALACLHENGIIYRNLHPRHVLIATDGAVKLTDFALARLDFMPSLAATTTVLSEPQMMSPEQLTQWPDALDARSDLYALGVLMYRMLSGFYPFDNANVAVLLKEICEARIRPLDELRTTVPKSLSRVVMRLLQRSPDSRFPNASNLLDALRHVEEEVGEAV